MQDLRDHIQTQKPELFCWKHRAGQEPAEHEMKQDSKLNMKRQNKAVKVKQEVVMTTVVTVHKLCHFMRLINLPPTPRLPPLYPHSFSEHIHMSILALLKSDENSRHIVHMATISHGTELIKRPPTGIELQQQALLHFWLERTKPTLKVHSILVCSLHWHVHNCHFSHRLRPPEGLLEVLTHRSNARE